MERLANRILLLTGWRRYGLALVAGAATAFAQAPFHLFAICFLTFPIVVWLLDGAFSPARRSRLPLSWPAFAVGWWFGLGYFVVGLWWIGNALFVEAEDFLWLWPFAVLGLPAILAIFYGLATVVARALWSDGLGRIAALAFGFAIAEWLRSFVLTGFPWNAIGYAAMPVPLLMQPAALAGIFAVNALAVLVFALPAAFSRGGARALAAAMIMLVVVVVDLGYGYARLASAPEPDPDAPLLRIVQPSVDQSEKWADGRRAEIFDLLLDLSTAESDAGQKPDVIVWPETSVPFILTRAPDAVSAIADALDEGQTLLAGAVREDEAVTGTAGRYYNSILAISDEGVIFDAADKVHLVPFGEYLPFSNLLGRLGLQAIAAADRGYSAAERRNTLSLPDGLTVLPSICYEAIFPSETVYAGEEPNLIVNVTNDAWYGDTPGPYQHIHQARIRAVETGLPMVRAANNGISAIYDGYGRQAAALGYGARGAIENPLPVAAPPSFYARHGNLFFWIFMALLGLCSLYGRLSGRRSPGNRSKR